MIPLLKASLSPWFMNWRGMKRSRATIDASRGKSAYAVFAASTRISIVATCSRSRAACRAEDGAGRSATRSFRARWNRVQRLREIADADEHRDGDGRHDQQRRGRVSGSGA
jgi:hypothetical protein